MAAPEVTNDYVNRIPFGPSEILPDELEVILISFVLFGFFSSLTGF